MARHSAGLNDAERSRLREVIEALQTDAGVTLPEGITLELLETARTAAGSTYQDLAQWCNEEMSRAVLGQTLTSSEGQRNGSLALAQVHNEVRRDYLRADAWWLMDIVNAQLVRPVIELNYGEEFSCPRWRIDTRPEVDRTQEIEVDRQLLRMGVPLPTAYFYEKFGRPAPAGEEETLAYDDANVFQYHLQHGVLTVNEVRAKLGLPAVSWGNRPTSPAGAPPGPPTSHGSAREDRGRFENEEIEEEEEDEAAVR